MDSQLNNLIQSFSVIPNFESIYSQVVRKALDYVIDRQNTGRTLLSQAEKAEKTIFGMKVESYLRNDFSWTKGPTLDFMWSGIEFDSKATIGRTWMIPTEAIDRLCLLTQIDEKKGTFRAGLLRMTMNNLTAGQNQDKKRSVSSDGITRIHWIILDRPIP